MQDTEQTGDFEGFIVAWRLLLHSLAFELSGSPHHQP